MLEIFDFVENNSDSESEDLEPIIYQELELELIDFGLEEIGEDSEGNIIIRATFTEFGHMAKALEERKIEVISAELTRIPTNTTELDDESAQDVFKLIDKLEQDEDVQKVYHNMK